MTPCTFRIDYVFERYFPQHWNERMCFRINRWDDMVVADRGGNLWRFHILGYRSMDDVRFVLDMSTTMNERRHAMGDCVHIFLIGPQASGKTTLARALEERGYEMLIPYTTRPPRDDERDGVDYIFVSDREFEKLVLDGRLACVRSYSTVKGMWSYAFAKDDLHRAVDSVAVIDPESYMRIHDQIDNCFGIYLDIPEDVRRARLLIRGDDPDEIERRMKSDAYDFATIDMCFRDVCRMRIGMVRRPDIEADRILGHVRRFRDAIFAAKTRTIVKE